MRRILFILICMAVASSVETAMAKPNFVFILTDDQDSYLNDYMPNLQGYLANGGVTFEKAFVEVSLCCPSRATIFTGRYSQNTGVFSNSPINGAFEKFYTTGDVDHTYGVWLKNAGYQTAYYGKVLNSYPGTAARKVNPLYVLPGWDDFFGRMTGLALDFGFGYGLNDNGKKTAIYGQYPAGSVDNPTADYSAYNISGNTDELYATDLVLAKASAFIDSAATKNAPFIAVMAFGAPHLPALPAPEFRDLFQNARVRREPSLAKQDMSANPTFENKRLLDYATIQGYDQNFIDRARSLASVDKAIGKLFDQLYRLRVLDNTYVVFLSDNGFHLGQHNAIMGKQSGYDVDIKVPMLISGPNVDAGLKVTHLVNNSDLAVTLSDLAGAPANWACDGRSLAPLLKRGTQPSLDSWRQSMPIAHFAQFGEADGVEDGDWPSFHGIRSQKYTYIEYDYSGTGFKGLNKALFDNEADPYQIKNIYGSAPAALLQQMADKTNRFKSCAAASCRTIENEKISP